MEKALIWLTLFRGLLCCIFEGTDFMIVSPVVDDVVPWRLLQITASGKEGTLVTVSTRSPIKQENHEQVIANNGFAQFSLQHSTHTITTENIPFPIKKNGIRVNATEPVVVFVYADNIDGYTAITRTNTTSYVTASTTASQADMDAKSYIAIAAFEEGTEVVVQLRNNVNLHEAQFGNREYEDNDIISAIINASDVMFIWCFNDLTGSQITANKPVSVFAGVTCAHVPEGSSRCQAVAEQMIPYDLLRGDVLNFPVFDISDNTLFRVISAQSTTDVLVGSDFHELVQRGSIVSWESSSPNGQVVSSNKSIINVQYQPDGGSVYWPLQTTMLPFSMFSATHTIFALRDADTKLVIITSKSQNNHYEFVLDDQPMTQFTIVEVHSAYVAVRSTLSPGMHTLRSLDSKEVAVYVYSYNTAAALSFHGACTVQKLTEQSTIGLASSSQAALASSVVIIQSASTTPESSTLESTMPHSSTVVSTMPHSSTPVSATPQPSTSVSATPQSSTAVSTFPQSSTSVSTLPQSSTSVSSLPQSSTSVSILPQSSTSVSAMPQSSTSPSTRSHSSTQSSTRTHSSTQSSTKTHSSTQASTVLKPSAPVSTTPQSSTQLSTMLDPSTQASTVLEPSAPVSTTPQSSTQVTTMLDPPTPVSPMSQTSNGLDSTTVISVDSAGSSGVAVTVASPQTTSISSSTPSITTSPCTPAACHYLCYTPTNASQMLQLIRNLTLLKRSLGSSIRKRTSVHDDRPSAKGIGYTGVVLMLVPVCLLFLGDLSTIIRDIKGHIR
ncbi:serine-rich adhesin for platelets-like isoform X2 [Haliotis rubra]|uniref:serine-rich adhesin for platelets-like isoform X2 n=1 Tax=Haliotis rubra TaxID=36100 RepID=UPI001EE5D2D2|nr:serine-rich adhesin for platelets-like isoform X2 [Haliotis rubra]